MESKTTKFENKFLPKEIAPILKGSNGEVFFNRWTIFLPIDPNNCKWKVSIVLMIERGGLGHAYHYSRMYPDGRIAYLPDCLLGIEFRDKTHEEEYQKYINNNILSFLI